jgi:succinate dehydrogenase flavin-adding protein (antitoxin of CptAB toxin-antitoxin module)
LRKISAEDQQHYVNFLKEEDNDMFSWFMRAAVSKKADVAHIVEIILASKKNTTLAD